MMKFGANFLGAEWFRDCEKQVQDDESFELVAFEQQDVVVR